MKTIAIIGAGPGLGLALARTFGHHDHHAALVARSRARLDEHVALLAREGIRASGHVADVLDRPGLARTIHDIERHNGSIDVLAYNPTPKGEQLRLPEEMDVESALFQLNYSLLGTIESVRAVLPGMLARGDGALLLTGGYSARYPVPSHASAGVALAAQRNYAYVLNRGLADRGVYAGTVTVAGLIRGTPSGDEVLAAPPEQRAAFEPLLIDPQDIADTYWDMVTKRDRVEEVVGNPALVEATFR
ncbi:MAG: SDR family NAD(P)-dependent oxidoreductase [Acidimicrobiia bacterium]